MLITNAKLVTWGNNPRVLDNYALFIEDGFIREIGENSDLSAKYSKAQQIDANGQLVMPGNICAHTHFYGAYARGMSIPGPAPANFPEILERLWWSLDRALDKDTVYMSAMVCLIDAIKHGTTTLIDHHASPNYIEGSLDTIADAVNKAGLRAVLAYEVTDRDGMERRDAGITENIRFINSNRDNSMLRGSFGLHASMTVSDETLQKCVDTLPDGAGFHIHVAEHEADQDDSLKKYGKRVIHRLNDMGILGQNSITAHCIHIDDSEMQALKDSKTWITHQPRSNMNNGVGAMQFDKMMQNDMPICLGNDGFSNAMWAEWKAAYLLHKVTNRDPRSANGADVAKIAITSNARLVQNFFPEYTIGEISEGAVADIIFVDYKPFTPLNEGNLPWHILFGFEPSMVTTTIAHGKVLMRDRQLLTLDEASIMKEALALAPELWERYNDIVQETL